MVDFRYHLVSILAVFLALAVGIVLGTAAINPAIVTDLRGRVDNLTTNNAARRAEIDELTGQLRGANTFSEAVLPVAVAGRLTGQRVTLVTTPDADKRTRDGVASVVKTAGGEVAGIVELQDKLADPDAAAELDTLATSVVPAGLTFPEGAPAIQRIAAELAEVLGTSSPVTGPADPPGGTASPTQPTGSTSPGATATASGAVDATPTPSATATGAEAGTPAPDGTPTPSPSGTAPRQPASPEDVVKVLTAFEQADLIALEGEAPATDIFVVVARTPPAEATPESRAAVHVVSEVVGALATTSRAVVAVSPRGGAVAGSLIDGVRRDLSLSSDVSSVDNADTPAGRVATVFAIVERLSGGFGHYGDGGDAIPDLTDGP
jgi:hypothetical protein